MAVQSRMEVAVAAWQQHSKTRSEEDAAIAREAFERVLSDPRLSLEPLDLQIAFRDDSVNWLVQRYKVTRDRQDIARALELSKETLSLVPDDWPDRRRMLHRVGSVLLSEWAITGKKEVREQALPYLRAAGVL